MANPDDVRHEPEIGARGWSCIDMIHEFDIDHGLMVENLLDPSHLPFTHEGTLARRKDAQPLLIDVERLDEGFRGWVSRSRQADAPPQGFTFIPSCTVRLDLGFPPKWVFIQVQYCVSLRLERPRMRLISRMIRNNTWMPALKWLGEFFFRRILRQDTAMLLGQQARLERGAKPWNCPVGADRVAVEYRHWRDRMPRTLSSGSS